MNMPANANDERLDWIRQYTEGTADAETTAQLESALRDDAAFRTLFIEYLNVDLALASSAVLSSTKVVPTRHWLAFPSRLMQFAAALAILATAAWLFLRPAVGLQRVVGAEFAAKFHRGDLVGQSAELKAGLIELHFRKADATVVIEAPAKFRIEDAKTIRIESGRVSAHVKDGRQGLRVLTPHMDVLDLGTRFAVDVREGLRSEVHVFEGEVEAGIAGELNREPLLGNQARRFAASAAPEMQQVRTGSFVQPEEMKPLAMAWRSGQSDRALASVALLQRDAALVGWLGFEDEADTPPLAGTRIVQGRFPGYRALEFVDRDDHAKLDLPTTTRKLTMLAWVRLDRVPEGISSLYHTDGWNTPGQVHWMILNSGSMRFAIKGAPSAEMDHGRDAWPESTGAVLHPLGRWLHLAAVYDADAQSVTFFTDGRQDSIVAMKTGLPAVLGPAQIGNWNIKAESGTEHRRLSGRMDELAIFTRLLSADEIRSHYESGNPYR